MNRFERRWFGLEWLQTSLVQWHKHGLWRQTALSWAPLPPGKEKGGWQGKTSEGAGLGCLQL